jgi:arylsulfatase
MKRWILVVLLMAIRVEGWKMHIGVKPNGLWWDAKYYPSVPYLFNLLMDPMEKMDPESHEWGYIGRKFFGAKAWAPTAADPFLAAHLKSLGTIPTAGGRHSQHEEGDRRNHAEVGEPQ